MIGDAGELRTITYAARAMYCRKAKRVHLLSCGQSSWHPERRGTVMRSSSTPGPIVGQHLEREIVISSSIRSGF